MYRRIARTDPSLFRPVGPVRPLRAPLSENAFSGAFNVTQAANVAFVLGWRHAYTGPIFCCSLLWLLSYRNSWSMVYHNDNVLVLHALVLGLTPSADALSVDSAYHSQTPRGRSFRALTRGGSPPPSSALHRRYGWPIKLINSTTMATYFLAGVAKLKGPLGTRWATGESLRSQVAADGLRKELLGGKAATAGLQIYERVAVYRILALGSLAIEIGAPLALARPGLSRLWALGAFGMHWGILGVMGIRFRYQLTGLAFAPFFELERMPHLLRRLRRRPTERRRLGRVFDGRVGRC